ncbi:MAG: 3-methyladenine DNA glycosylase, partial [Cyanobacteria bacterium J06649_4]
VGSIFLLVSGRDSTQDITQTTRIGLSKGADIPWRWYLSTSPAVSRK